MNVPSARLPVLHAKFSEHVKSKTLFFSSNIHPRPHCSKVNGTLSLDSSKLEADDSSPNQIRWKSIAKRKVAMRIGYVGTDYKGLQIQRDSAPAMTIEGELERAIFKAGGMLESNYGDLHKIGWRRSSRTDKGVHSLATVIALKMEVPGGAWEEDLDGIALADVINRYLPYNVRVFSILPVNKGFDARTDCISRKYLYLLPAEVIGIGYKCGPEETEHHISTFKDILQMFEGNHPFHNYTVRAQYRKRSSKSLVKVSRPNSFVNKESIPELEHKRKHGSSANDGNNLEQETSSLEYASDIEEDFMTSIQGINCGSNISNVPELSKCALARWLHEPDEADKISAAHFRKILSCTCGGLETIKNTQYIEVRIHGESFMFHQIRKMVGTAVAVKRGLLPQDIIKMSLSRFSRVVLPLAPSEVLILSGSEFYIPDKFNCNVPSNVVAGRFELSRLTGSTRIQGRANDFYSALLLPDIAKFLDPSKPPWKEWLENLDQCAIPDIEINKLRVAWTQCQENYIPRKQKVS